MTLQWSHEASPRTLGRGRKEAQPRLFRKEETARFSRASLRPPKEVRERNRFPDFAPLKSTIRTVGKTAPPARSGKIERPVAAFAGVVERFERWRRRPEDDGDSRPLGPHHGRVPGVIPNAFVLPVGRIVLFVHDDQLQPIHGREDGRPHAHGYAGLAGSQPLPLVPALRVREAGMEDGNGVAEPSDEPADELRRERDLRNEDERTASLPDDLLDEA